jgi:cellulose synthase/poly-beta-1,6-N-acetylglucosamine synthase-like glycosyltransferase
VTATAQPPASEDDLGRFVRGLSCDQVVAVDPSGPIFSATCSVQRELNPATFVPALDRRPRSVVALLTGGWALTCLLFWIWWCLPQHRTSWVAFAVNSVLLFYITMLPVYFLAAANRLRRVSPALDIPRLRVAMVVTKAPSEPWPLVRTTLEAMLAQAFPYAYDVWLCDENPSETTLVWCADNGVQVSTRRGVEAYQRIEWPRRRRCKEGNLAYFYDRYGYRDYDVVSQLDCDHVPEPSYLAEMVRPFADPAIGYVAAPSVCGKNRSQSWAVRGRLFHEANFHGPLQLGHNLDWAPISIGSHYAVRTEALASIGGIGPELAEDFSTSYLMYTGGWRGAFAIDAHAQGDGPPDFGAMVTQEFQWSRSLCLILFKLMPRTLRRVERRVRWRFVFCLGWYPLLAATSVAGLALTAAAPVFGVVWMRVNFFQFVVYSLVMTAWLLGVCTVFKRQDLLRPKDAPIVSWEAMLYVLTSWPFITWGLVAALIQTISPRHIELKVTPKDVQTASPLPLKTVAPFVLIVAVLSTAALIGIGDRGMVGYVGLCLIAAATYAVVGVAIPLLHGYEAIRTATGSARTFAALVRNTLPVWSVALIPLAIALVEYPAYFMQELSL